jgi:hypothetical protein
MRFIFDTDSITPDSGSGGSIVTKYGATINTLLGDIDANGVLQLPTQPDNLTFTGVKSLGKSTLYYKFYKSDIKSISFPDLEQAITTDCLNHTFYMSKIETASFPKLTEIDYAGYMFSTCNLASVSFPKLVTVYGSGSLRGLYYAFNGSLITNLEFPKLKTIVGDSHAFSYFCNSCPKLETVRFTELETIPTKSSASSSNFYSAFGSCPALKNIYFNAVTTSTFTGGYTYVFNNMFDNNSGKINGCTVHFPSNMQSIISGLTGYPTFGGNSSYITIAFDLPATT